MTTQIFIHFRNASVLLFSILLAGCLETKAKSVPSHEESDIGIIQDAQSTDGAVYRAIVSVRQMDRQIDSAGLWSEIANNNQRDSTQRRWAMLQLFDRFVHNGMTAKDVATVLNHPVWLQCKFIYLMHGLGGLVPLQHFGNGQTIQIGPDIPYDDRTQIYIRFEATGFTQEDYCNALHGNPSPADNAVVAEVGMVAVHEDEKKIVRYNHE